MSANMYNVMGCQLGLETVQDYTDDEIFNYDSGSKVAAEFSPDTVCELTLETIQDYIDNEIHYSVEEPKKNVLESYPNVKLALWTVQDNIDYEVYDFVPESSTVAVSYTCYICDTSMPLDSASAHLTSNIHQMWLSVSKLASEKLRRQSLEPPPLAQTPPSNTIICHTCSVLVDKDHSCPKKFTDREVTLRDFFEMWEKTVSEDSVLAGVDNKSDATEYGDSEIQYDMVPDAVCEERNEVPYSNEDHHYITTSKMDSAYIRNEIMNREYTTASEIEMMKYYEYIYEYMTEDQDCTHKILVQNELYLYIVTAMGDCIMVSQDHYHAFYTVNKRTMCGLCRCLVNNKYFHIRTEQHMDMVRSPLTDQRCIRQINLLWYHCVLCNEIIENVQLHLCNETHVDAFYDALIIPGYVVAPVNGSTENELLECVICATTLEREDLRYHAASPEHKRRLHKKILQLGDDDPMFSHYQLHRKQGRLYCRLCHFEINETTDCIADHIANDHHKMFYQRYLNQDRTKQNQSKIQCKVSSEDHVMNIRDSTKSESDCAINSVTGMSLSRDPIISQLFKYGLLVAEKRWKTCKICNISFADWQSHFESVEHGFYFNVYMNINQIEGRSPHYKCAPCNLPLEPNNVIDHIIQKNHNLRDTYMCRELSKRPIAYMDSQTKGVIELIGDGNEVYCKACGTTFLNQITFIYEHVRERRHKVNRENNCSIQI